MKCLVLTFIIIACVYWFMLNENNNKTEVKTTKRDTFNLYVQFLKSVFDSGTAISFIEIKDIINNEHEKNIVNSEVKTFLEEHFQNQIQLCSSERANESIFFSSIINSQNVLQKLRSFDMMDENCC